MKFKFLNNPPAIARNRRRSFFGALICGLAIFVFFSFSFETNKIKGKVFRDFNANGTFETSTTYQEIGVKDITVTAYDVTGAVAATTTTGSDGSYTLNSGSGNFRIEFTGLSTGDYDGAFSTGSGVRSGTTVQFASSGAEDVNLGINYPAHYSSTTNPKIVTSGFVAGSQSGADYAQNILWGVPFNVTNEATPNNLGTAAQLGAVWGTAYSKSTKKLYIASFTKRHVGFGPSGPGAIYVTTLSGDLTATTPTTFYDFPDANVGGSSIHGTLSTTASETSTDNSAFDNVGKTSLGDIELSEDEKYLYVVNLYDRTLNKIEIANTTNKVTTPIPSPVAGTYANDYRPFALKVYRGKVYVGVVGTNESSYPAADATDWDNNNTTNVINNRGTSTGMKGYVYEFDGTSFTTVLDFPLTYKKQASGADLTPAGSATRAQLYRPWTAIFRYDRGSSGGNLYSYPQAWLTGIEFDVNGDMIVGLRDRFGDQMGYQNLRPSGAVGPGTSALWSGVAPGEILRAGQSGSSWVMESKGSVNSSTRSTDQKRQFGPGGAGGTYTAHTLNSTEYFADIVTANVEGKYYWGDQVGVGGNHGSSSLGGVAVLPGSGKLIMTAMDPTDVWNTGGVKRLMNSDGFLNSNATPQTGTAGGPDDHTNGTDGASGTPGRTKGAILYDEGTGSKLKWGKANGMGEVEFITAPAPIELGNRIWKDLDGDGIQDAGEPGISGVVIKLMASNGTTEIASATTDDQGRYIFSNATGTNTNSFRYGLTALTQEGTYILRILNASGVSQQSALAHLKLTGTNKDATTNGDERDNDGAVSVSVVTTAEATITTGLNGDNNHSHDFGFAELVNLGNKVWKDVNNNGIIDSGEPVFAGVTVNLYADADNSGTVDGAGNGTIVATTTTDANGLYLFDNLLPGNYMVGVVTPTGFVSSGINAGDPDTDTDDNDDNGVTTVGTETRSHMITLVGGDEPTGENPSNNPSGAIADNSSNLTVDFGFVELVNLGNKVWKDVNNNGIIDSGEPVFAGVTVNLYADADNSGTVDGAGNGTIVATTTTDANGLYLFDKLLPGNYMVGVVTPTGYVSSGVNAGDPDTDTDDNDDNGVTTVGTETRSHMITLAPGGEPTSENPSNNPSGVIADNSSNLTVDFGFVELVNLGNKVWRDANNNGIIDSGELPISGVVVNLYADADNSGTVDGAGNGTIVATTTTDENGLYLFDNLLPGNYMVGVVTPTGLFSSTVNAGDPDTDTDDNDDNGVTTVGNETRSDMITLVPQDEPLSENPNNNGQVIADKSSNLTVDFGFYNPSALPVKLMNFNGKADDAKQVLLSWNTTEESNSSYFEVQRSIDGKGWNGIGNVSAQGESKELHPYAFKDVNPFMGENLYRLKMVDQDATFAYSRIISVKLETSILLNLFPNPASDRLKIEAASGEQVHNVRIYTSLGKLIQEVKSPKQNEVNVQSLSPGIYFVKITTASGSVETRKIIISR
jgi:protocatechuate 3,4-dioxygenase beta subunit